MKALLLQDKNKWTEMKVEEIEKPLPNKGEVVVEVHAVDLIQWIIKRLLMEILIGHILTF